jgi:hypothetical protein
MPASTVERTRGRRMPPQAVRAAGLVTSFAYAALIVWVYSHQPQTIAEVSGGLASSVGAYRADPAALAEGRQYFYKDQFIEARLAFDRADPAQIAAAPDGRIVVQDAQLKLHSSDELKAELERGLTREVSDFNPLKVFRERK